LAARTCINLVSRVLAHTFEFSVSRSRSSPHNLLPRVPLGRFAGLKHRQLARQVGVIIITGRIRRTFMININLLGESLRRSTRTGNCIRRDHYRVRQLSLSFVCYCSVSNTFNHRHHGEKKLLLLIGAPTQYEVVANGTSLILLPPISEVGQTTHLFLVEAGHQISIKTKAKMSSSSSTRNRFQPKTVWDSDFY
jgi:hypothetical protein